jgi:hypothetical protein
MEKYDYDYKLTYYDYHDDEMKDDIYRAELLKVFKMDDFNDTQLSDKVTEIYNTISHIDSIKNLAKSLAEGYGISDDSFGMIIVFGFQTFHNIHKVLKEYYQDGTVNETEIENIKKHLEK